ncbi:putative uridine nucleosidase [Phaeomoniella chlamydospora]|uniref:Putative uridine nucleosidase n=1 Tax=Phaeomoniella chlamydospora TaxID=158046 RepID=A0A0G2GCM5_PHACM|nr:putative uridine nucleosidase [Phaeomoniella chlamydospora]
MGTKIPVWLDCDPGHDDAFAILLAAYHPELELLGVSTIHGNASLEKTTKNALRVLEAIGRPDILVYPGARRPFCRAPHHAPDIHGDSGLDGTDLLPQATRKSIAACNPIYDIYQALMRQPAGKAWVIATGAMTNVALLFSTFPDLVDHIKGFNIMGGAIGNGFTDVPLGPSFHDESGILRSRIGNYTPYAEFNIWCDPESAESLFINPALARKTMIAPLDLTHQAFANKDIQHIVMYGEKRHVFLKTSDERPKPTKLRQMFHELLMFFAKTYADVFDLKEGPPLHDPLAVAFIFANDDDEGLKIPFFDEGERYKVEVELAGPQIGRTKVTKADDGVIIPKGFDGPKFWAVLNDCLETADARSPLN